MSSFFNIPDFNASCPIIFFSLAETGTEYPLGIVKGTWYDSVELATGMQEYVEIVISVADTMNSVDDFGLLMRLVASPCAVTDFVFAPCFLEW
jgi:hypothetical protein